MINNLEKRTVMLSVFGVVMIGYLFLSINSYVEKHETIHAETCRYAGGEPNVDIYYDIFPPGIHGEFICEGTMDGNFSDDIELLILNDIIGYNLQIVSITIVFVSFVLGTVIIIEAE